MTKVRASTMATRSAPEAVPAPQAPTNGASQPEAVPEPPAAPKGGDLVVLRLHVGGDPSDAELALLGRFMLEASQRGMSAVEYYNHLADMLDAYDRYVPEEARQS